MIDTDTTRENLVLENTALRLELAVLRSGDLSGRSTDALEETKRFKTLVTEVPEYLYSIEFRKGKITPTYHSPRCEEITGYAPVEYAENPFLWLEMIHPDDRARVQEFIQGLKEPLYCKSIEHRIVRKDGAVRWVVNMTTVHLDNEGSTLRQSGFILDVTGRREEEAENLRIYNENRHNSLIDDLTELYNRRGFRELAEQQLRVAERINQPVLLFFIDVDRLKQTNDAFGHPAGDELLVSLAQILKRSFRESDLIARMGGDEFTVLTMETGPDSNDEFIERLRANIEERNNGINDARRLAVSVGVSRYNLRDSDTITSLIDRADKNMYDRKRSKYI